MSVPQCVCEEYLIAFAARIRRLSLMHLSFVQVSIVSGFERLIAEAAVVHFDLRLFMFLLVYYKNSFFEVMRAAHVADASAEMFRHMLLECVEEFKRPAAFGAG